MYTNASNDIFIYTSPGLFFFFTFVYLFSHLQRGNKEITNLRCVKRSQILALQSVSFNLKVDKNYAIFFKVINCLHLIHVKKMNYIMHSMFVYTYQVRLFLHTDFIRVQTCKIFKSVLLISFKMSRYT